MTNNVLKGFAGTIIYIFLIEVLVRQYLYSHVQHWFIGLLILLVICFLLGGFTYYLISKDNYPLKGGLATLFSLILVDIVWGMNDQGNFTDDYGYYIFGFFTGMIGTSLASRIVPIKNED